MPARGTLMRWRGSRLRWSPVSKGAPRAASGRLSAQASRSGPFPKTLTLHLASKWLGIEGLSVQEFFDQVSIQAADRRRLWM